MSRETAGDLAARTIVGALFAMLSANLLADFLRTGHLTGMLLLVSEGLILVLTIVRRRAHTTDRSIAATVTTALSIAGPPLLRAGNAPGLLSDDLTAIVSAVGLILVIGAKITLGRSFGIVPANRGVVARGPYRLMRHPIYAGYLICHAAFVVAHPTALNVALVLVSDAALIVRALLEERVLSADVEYQAYCRRVEWHLVPGVF
jgi:protein-S-isoprenylcysteine O-methyltransferase Ste14